MILQKLQKVPTSSHKQSRNLFFLFGVLLFIKMLVLNFLTPLGNDDGIYSGALSVLDALQREYNHFFNWGGRSISHFIIRVFRMWPKGVFNVFTSLVFVGFSLLIYKIATPQKSYKLPLYLLIVFFLWLYTPVYGQVYLWLTGSVVYLWGTTIILGFLLPYILYASGKTVFKHKYLPIAGMFLLGVAAGWSMENTSGGMILIAALMFGYCLIFKHKIMLWMVGGLVGSIAGFLLLLLAPGNLARMEYIQAKFPDNRHIVEILAERVGLITTFIIEELSVLIIVFIVLITMLIVIHKDWKRAYVSFAFFIASIATAYAMIASLYIPGRSMFGTTIFMIIACAHTFAGISFDKEPYKIAAISFLCILAFQFSTTIVIAVEDIGKSAIRHHYRTQYIRAEIARGNLNVEMPHYLAWQVPTTKWNPRFGFTDLSHDPSYLVNVDYALNFGLESIRWAP